MEMNEESIYYKSPIGSIKITGNEDGILSVFLTEDDRNTSLVIPDCLKDCLLQLDEYFQNKRTSFRLKLNPQGSDFQKKVWYELQNISFGKTISYLDQAKRMGNAKAIRAIAAANGKNPIGIIIPCHRVIGSDGSLTGYAGGIWRKKWLIEHENPTKQITLF